jgi:hypothetical protein
MNCKQIKEEIDAAPRHNPYSGAVRFHLNGCGDCRRYSDETASLTRLLGAQPRVEAPSDFEFRLRARLLREQAAPAIAPRGFSWKILPGTFSWGQTVSAAAALTLVITVSFLYVNRGTLTPGPGGANGGAGALADQRPNGAVSAPETRAPATESVAATPVRFTSRNVKVRSAPFESESLAPPNDVAGIDDSAPLYSPGTKRLLKDRSVFYGAETASISQPKPMVAALTF